jgi:hypothetical protein
MEYFYQTYNLGKETNDFINRIKVKFKKAKSEIIGEILRYFKQNTEELKQIIFGDLIEE